MTSMTWTCAPADEDIVDSDLMRSSTTTPHRRPPMVWTGRQQWQEGAGAGREQGLSCSRTRRDLAAATVLLEDEGRTKGSAPLLPRQPRGPARARRVQSDHDDAPIPAGCIF